MMSRGIAVMDEGEAEGTLSVFIDESYRPVIAGCAVVLESVDVPRLETEVVAKFDQFRDWYFMRGLPTFESFREEGFHASSNPPEVQTAFVAFLAEALNFKTFIAYSDRASIGETSEKRRLMIVFAELVNDVVRAHRGRPRIELCFEASGPLDKYVEQLVARVVQRFGRSAPEVVVRFGHKRNPSLLAIPDYVLHIFGRWLKAAEESRPKVRVEQYQDRAFMAIVGSISVAREISNPRPVRRSTI